MRHDLQYLYRVANNFIGMLDLRNSDVTGLCAEDLCWQYGAAISGELRKWSPAKLGELACYGRAYHEPEAERRVSLYEVHNGTWLDKYGSGRSMLLSIAVTTVVAAITDVLNAEAPRRDGRRRNTIPDASRYASR